MFLFPTIATRHPKSELWVIDIHGWIYRADTETKIGRAIRSGLRKRLDLEATESPETFLARSSGFAVENLKGRRPRIRIGSFEQLAKKSKRNGHFRLKLRLGNDFVEPSLQTTPNGNRILPIEVQFDDLGGPIATQCHVVNGPGLSIISDLDDTIKNSNVLDKQELMKNTFLREFSAVEGMPELLQSLAVSGNTFHYVSATPWQLYRHVDEFLKQSAFPDGSVHLRKFTLKDVTVLKKLTPTHKGKRKTIEDLIHRCPGRSFVLIGDSGEHDPEMYADVARKFPTQIERIFIRNISGESSDNVRWSRAFTQLPKHIVHVFNNAKDVSQEFQRLAGISKAE